jgi:hypothetical protein
MRLLIFLIAYLTAMQVTMAGETLEMNGKDALLLSAGLMDEEKYNQALPISLAIYEQRNKDYVVAGILSMKAYINIGNTKRAAFIGDEIKSMANQWGHKSMGSDSIDLHKISCYTETSSNSGGDTWHAYPDSSSPVNHSM